MMQKHQRKLLGYFYKNVLNRKVEDSENVEWKSLLSSLGQVKKTFNQVF